MRPATSALRHLSAWVGVMPDFGRGGKKSIPHESRLGYNCPTLPVTENWTPDTAHDAVRDVVRAREAAVKNRTRKRQEIRSFLLHHQNKATGRPRQFPILATPRENMIRVHVILAHQDRHLNPGLVTLRHDQVLVAAVS